MMPIININHEATGLPGFLWALADWWNILLTSKYRNLNSVAKVVYILLHTSLEIKRVGMMQKMRYAQLTLVLKMNDAIKYS